MGAGAAAELKAATQPCPSGHFPSRDVTCSSTRPRAGTGRSLSEDSLPVLTSASLGLSASWSHPRSAQVVQGAGGRKLRGRGTRLVQVLGPTALSFSQSNDWMRPGSPDLGGCPLPTLHSRSSLGLTHAPAAAPSCAPLLWGLSFRDTSFPCCQDGHSDEDAMLIHPLWPSWG